MNVRDKINADPGFQYIIDNLEIMSAPGRRALLEQPFLVDPSALNSEYDNIERAAACLADNGLERQNTVIRHQFMQLHDLRRTLDNLQQGSSLDEIELFELKNLAFICRTTAKAAAEAGIGDLLRIPDTDAAFALLDPDGTGIPNFYIYDSYHHDLPDLRRELKQLQMRIGDSQQPPQESAELQLRVSQLLDRQNVIQQQVLTSLSDQLRPLEPLLRQAFDRMAYSDLLFAKASLARAWHLVRPSITTGSASSFKGLWNPRLKHRNDAAGLRYQPVDIDTNKGVCLITGANMAGKTVLLKTIGITQLLAQTGFFVPAEVASIQLVDDVAFCIGDEQNEMNGLSSFASEIIKISDTINLATQKKMLILIDEPARTTNPVEGKAIVQALANILDASNSSSLITTHYSQLGLPCRRLRVRGFVEDMADSSLSPDNINRFMDYSLLPDDSDEVPHEALRIATILGCNTALVDTAQKFLDAKL